MEVARFGLSYPAPTLEILTLLYRGSPKKIPSLSGPSRIRHYMEYPKGERGIATITNYLKKQLPIACMIASKAWSIDM